MERYGTMPKRFSKDWWDHIWTYYKWHFVTTLIILFFATTTIVQCVNKIDYDLSITYAGDQYIDEIKKTEIETALSEQIDDANGNDRKDVYFQPLIVSEDPKGDLQFRNGMQMKVSLEYQAGESYLFLFSEKQRNILIYSELGDGFLIPVSEWNKDQTDDAVYVSLAGNKFFEQFGIETDDLYMGVRLLRTSEKDKEKLRNRYENAKKIAEYIVNYQ